VNFAKFSGILGIALAVLGGLGILGSLEACRSDQAVSTWPKVQGKIISRDVAARTRHGRYLVTKTTEYSPTYTYQFVVNGKTYTMDSELASRDNANTAKAEMAILRGGQSISVCYNPKDPDDNFIVGEQHASMGMAQMFGSCLMVIVGLGILFRSFRNRLRF